MKTTKKTTITILAMVLFISIAMVGCSSASNESDADKTNETQTAEQIVLNALLDPKMVYADDRLSWGEEAYKITTEYMKMTEPIYDLSCYKWQLPDGYVLEVREDRGAYLTTFPIGGRKTDDDPSVFETRKLWANIDTGDIENVTSRWYAVHADGTFAIEYVSKDTYEVVAWKFGEIVAELPISIKDINKTGGFVDSFKHGNFYYGSDGACYSNEYSGVFFENGNELYFCYKADGEYKAELIADDYTGSFGTAASSIFYIDEQANLIQLDVYDNMDRIEKSIIGKNVYALTAYAGNVSWREMESDEVLTPEHYVSLNEKKPFGWEA